MLALIASLAVVPPSSSELSAASSARSVAARFLFGPLPALGFSSGVSCLTSLKLVCCFSSGFESSSRLGLIELSALWVVR